MGENRIETMTEPSKLPHHGVPDHQPAAGGIAARARAAAAPSYLSRLNPEQREAVETLDGPVLVLAGAGTGKTRVLTCRIAHILSQGRARPGEILSVTFTNKAAREMKLRLGQMLGQAVEGMPWLGTFHSIGGRILRTHAEMVQLKSNFTVLDTDDQVRLLKQLLQAEGIDDKRWPARMLAGLIDGWKNRGLGPSQVPSGEAAVFANGKGGKLYASYQERLEDSQRRRFRRFAPGKHPPVPRTPGRAAAIPAPLQVHSGRRIPRHQRRAVSLAAAARHRRRVRHALSPLATPSDPSLPGIAVQGTASLPLADARQSIETSQMDHRVSMLRIGPVMRQNLVADAHSGRC